MEKLIINDEIDLRSKNKELLTYDSIYKKHNVGIINNDSKSNVHMKDGVYAILSVSDKIINNRLYLYDSLKENVMNRDWTKPFNKPFLKNHDIYCDSLGRIKRAWFVDHSTFQVFKPNDEIELPTKVLDHYKSIDAFSNGTGTTIVELSVSDEEYERIKLGLDQTVSQSSYTNSMVCNICKKPYYGGECTHLAGDSYKIGDSEELQTCYVISGDFEPVELSIVNSPANDSSILYISSETDSNTKDEKTTEIDKNKTKDTIKENVNIQENTDSQENTESQNKDNMEDLMYKDMLKKMFSDQVKDKLTEDGLNAFNTLLDSLNSAEQITNLQTILNNIKLADCKEENKDEKVSEKTKENKETETKDEETPKDEKENQNEKESEKEHDKENQDEVEHKVDELSKIFDKKTNNENIDDSLTFTAKAIINNF